MRAAHKLFMFLCLTLFAVNTTFAQETEVLHEQVETIGPLKRFEWYTPSEMKFGEQLILKVEVLGGKRIAKVIVDPPGTQFDFVASSVRDIERKVFDVDKQGAYAFTFVNRGGTPKKVRIKIERVPRISRENKKFLDDILITSYIDSIQHSKVDTIPWPDVQEMSVYLGPQRDFETDSDTCLLDSLLGIKNQFAVYWVGVGDEALAEYDKLKSSPPPSWQIEGGVNEPILAYGLGLTHELPRAENSLSKGVILQVQNPDPALAEDPRLVQLTPVEDFDRTTYQSFPYGFISKERAGKYNKVKLCLKNLNTTSGVNIHIKVAKFRVVKESYYERISRERVQEVFLEKSIKKKDEN